MCANVGRWTELWRQALPLTEVNFLRASPHISYRATVQEKQMPQQLSHRHQEDASHLPESTTGMNLTAYSALQACAGARSVDLGLPFPISDTDSRLVDPSPRSPLPPTPPIAAVLDRPTSFREALKLRLLPLYILAYVRLTGSSLPSESSSSSPPSDGARRLWIARLNRAPSPAP